jgi:hypothetical protein
MNTSAPQFLGPRTDPPRARTEHQPRFITAAEWQAKYGKKAAS